MDPGGVPISEAQRLVDDGDYDAAVRLLRPAMEDGDPDALVLGANALRRAGRARPALHAAERAREVRPSWGPALAAVAAATVARGRAAEGEQAAQAALSVAPNEPDVWNAAGLAAIAGGDRAEAQRCFEHGLRLDADHGELRQNLDRLGPGDDGVAHGADGATGGNAVSRFLRRRWFISVLPERAEDANAEPVPMVAWWGLVAVAIGVGIVVFLGAR